jgi:hypothetical protein
MRLSFLTPRRTNSPRCALRDRAAPSGEDDPNGEMTVVSERYTMGTASEMLGRLAWRLPRVSERHA